MTIRALPNGLSSPEALSEALRAAYYLADDGIATAAFLSLALGKPLLLEGAPGVGKTEAAKALSGILGRQLLRLQCFEGIDASAALYEWNYPRQMLQIRLLEATGAVDVASVQHDLFSPEYLLKRPLLPAGAGFAGRARNRHARGDVPPCRGCLRR